MRITNNILQFSHTQFEEPTIIRGIKLPIIAFTKVKIMDKDYKPLADAACYCSEEDAFSREVGRKRALARAIIKALPNRKEMFDQRLSIWEGYRTSKPGGRW